jgi:predicted Rossmann-fold nucleotide-binding protein
LGILSCANIVDFRSKGVVNEQKINPYIDAKMTYRLDRLVERQAEFYLDVPIFLPGGVGMDFEYALEEVRRKTGSSPATPVLLFGEVDYWRRKIASRFQLNRETGTIKGSEWVSNCFYCIQTAKQGISVLKRYFANELPIGKEGPIYDDGFCIVR